MIEKVLLVDITLSGLLALAPDSRWWRPARFLAHLGDGPNIFTGLILIYLGDWWGQRFYIRQAALVTLISVVMTMVVITAIKYLVRRQRPRLPGEFVVFAYDKYSFPSGHAGRMAVLMTSLSLFFPYLGWLLIPLAFSVAIARIVVGIHYLSDIVVGLLVGIVIGWFFFSLFSIPIF